MTTYQYHGPNSSVTLKVDDGAGNFIDQDVVFWRGQNVDLPADHPVTLALASQGFLTPLPLQ